MSKREQGISPRDAWKNFDAGLAEMIAKHFIPNIDLVGIHLRDARNLLDGGKEGSRFDGVLAKAVVVLSAAALEANLAYLCDVCLTLGENGRHAYALPQIDYLRGTEKFINDRGDVSTRALKQGLEEKLKAVPSLLARALGREYQFPAGSASIRKLRETIALRDAIVHPRWDRYATAVGWFEAAQAIDAVELYLNSVVSQLHPYLAHYFHILFTIPEGGHKDDVSIAHRTFNKRPRRKQAISRMEGLRLTQIVSGEWLEARFITEFALGSQCEGDSEGSMLTRAALVLLYAMLDAQLSGIAQAYIHADKYGFEAPEMMFLTEFAAAVDEDGLVTVAEGHQKFKQRIISVPRILVRRVVGDTVSINLGNPAGNALLRYKDLRDSVMHPSVGQTLPRVTKTELREAEAAVRAYFSQLADLAPSLFGMYRILLKDTEEDLLPPQVV